MEEKLLYEMAKKFLQKKFTKLPSRVILDLEDKTISCVVQVKIGKTTHNKLFKFQMELGTET